VTHDWPPAHWAAVTQGARHWSSVAQTSPVAQVPLPLPLDTELHVVSSGSSQTEPALLCTQRSPALQSRDSLHALWHRPNAQISGESQSLLIEQGWSSCSRPASPLLELLQLGADAARKHAETRPRTTPTILFPSGILDTSPAPKLLPMTSYKSMHRPTFHALSVALTMGALALPLSATVTVTGCHGPATASGGGEAGTTVAGPSPSARPFDGTDEQAFTQSVAQFFDDEAPEMNATVVGPLAVQLVPRYVTVGADAGPRVALDRIWSGCKADPSTCEAGARDFVKKSVQSLRMKNAPAKRENIVAVLRSRAYVDSVGGPDTTRGIIQPFVGDLYVVYMVDLPGTMRSLTRNEIDGIAPDPRALPQIAAVNLAPKLGHLTDVIAKPAAGTFNVLQSHNVYESSRLLIGDEWAVLQKRVGNASIVVAAPAGDTLLVAIGPTPDQITAMRDTAKKMFAGANRPVSPDLFRWSQTTWTVVL
jgi:hypothetical protein